jgi:thioredoxin 2
MSRSDVILVKCKNCGTMNRIPSDKINLRARCGRCKAPLELDDFAEGMPIQVTDTNFEMEVLKSSLPVLLDCWAPWCGPCRMVSPIVDEIAKEMAGALKVGKLNVDENPIIASKFQIMSIPTLMVFKNGQVVDQIVGALPKAQILQRLKPHIPYS